MFGRVFICSLLVLFGIVTGAHAAVLRSSGGGVKVVSITGSAPQFAPQTMNVQPGTLVSVGDNSSATVIFSNGCSIDLRPGQELVVPERPPECSGGPPPTDNSSLIVLGGVAAVGGVIAVVGSQNKGKSASP